MTPGQLKASIFQYAIQGKLVEQRSGEGNAEDLYKEIQEEKQKLIKEGKLKKEKPLAEITEDEIPFDIPESWKWIRLRDICTKIVDGDHNPPAGQKQPTEYLMLSATNINYDKIVELDKVRYVTKEIFEIENQRTNVEINDIFFTIVGSMGRSCVYKGGMNICFQRSVSVLTTLIYSEYLKYVLDTPFIQNFMYVNATGTVQKGFYLKQVENLVIPLPPLEEQYRIVAKIEELLPLVDCYAASYEKLEQLNAKFPEDMKKSILQYAIQGKLVEQRPEEGNAEELYKEIQQEKQKLIKEGKLKKEKHLAEISEDEIPFDIPESWKWVRVGGLFNHNTGKAMNASAKKVDKAGVIRKFITTSNVYWNTLDLTTVKEMFFSYDELDRCTIKKGDLLMCEGGAYFGRTAIWNFDYDICFQNHVHRLRPYKELNLLYFYYVFYFYRNTGMMQSKGTAMPGLSSITLHSMVVPLPPLEEQYRIVDKIEELLLFYERLSK